VARSIEWAATGGCKKVASAASARLNADFCNKIGTNRRFAATRHDARNEGEADSRQTRPGLSGYDASF